MVRVYDWFFVWLMLGLGVASSGLALFAFKLELLHLGGQIWWPWSVFHGGLALVAFARAYYAAWRRLSLPNVWQELSFDAYLTLVDDELMRLGAETSSQEELEDVSAGHEGGEPPDMVAAGILASRLV